MKPFTQLVLSTLGIGLFVVLMSSLSSRHASAAPPAPTPPINAAKMPPLVGRVASFDRGDSHAPQTGSVAVGAVAAHLIGRIIIEPTGNAQWVGYLPYLAGISGTFFSGASSEATAYFTFRSTSFQEQAISNGNLTELFPNAVAQPLEIRVYLNSNPHGNFETPDTFSDGLLVARLQPERAMGTDTGSLTFAAGTYDVISGSDFMFQGQHYNIQELTCSLTIALTFGTPVQGESAGSPALVSSFGGYALAVGRTDNDVESER